MRILKALRYQLKYSGFLFAFGIVAIILWNTNVLFQNLSLEERNKMELWAMAQEAYIENQNISNLTFEVLQRSGINPMILVDENDRIIDLRNIAWDGEKQDSLKLYKTLASIKKENDPILIQFKDENERLIVNQKLYYGNSLILKKLQYYPLALLLIIFLFAAVLYYVFKTARISEQNRLWAAMAKETAHQIGTPLTSMMGWITLLQENGKDPAALDEIEKDIERLKVITNRFSKVGSIPELMSEDIVATTHQTILYLQQRSSNQVHFDIALPQKAIFIPINADLMSWTLENIIKNGIDAMKGKGTLGIQMNETDQQVELLISDNGSGIKKEHLKNIFNPGFTTKSRGWGLGLSLAKRIVVDFHGGKISVKKTVLGKGTVFQILLPKKGK